MPEYTENAPPEEFLYTLQYLPEHLRLAEAYPEAHELLSSFDFLQQKELPVRMLLSQIEALESPWLHLLSKVCLVREAGCCLLLQNMKTASHVWH